LQETLHVYGSYCLFCKNKQESYFRAGIVWFRPEYNLNFKMDVGYFAFNKNCFCRHCAFQMTSVSLKGNYTTPLVAVRPEMAPSHYRVCSSQDTGGKWLEKDVKLPSSPTCGELIYP
jgi:hypothetical protein